MTINSVRILEKFDESKEYIKHIKEIKDYSKKDYVDNRNLQFRGERLFEIIVQIMLDICSHIIANSDLPSPKTYSDCMNRLNDLNIINQKSVKKYRKIVKMRNIITHSYTKLNQQIIYNGLITISEDFKMFKKQILDWLETANLEQNARLFKQIKFF